MSNGAAIFALGGQSIEQCGHGVRQMVEELMHRIDANLARGTARHELRRCRIALPMTGDDYVFSCCQPVGLADS